MLKSPRGPRAPRRDREPLDAWRQALAAENIGLAKFLAAPYARRHPSEAAGYYSEAYYALVLAAADFDDGRGPPFGTYAGQTIRGHLMAYRSQIGRTYRHRGTKLGTMPTATMEAEDLGGRILGHDEPPPDDDGDAFEHRIGDLSARQAELCRLVHRDGMPVAVAGRALGMTRDKASSTIRDAYRVIRKAAAR